MLGNSLGLMQTRAAAGPVFTYATWNPSDADASWTLSNANLTAVSGGVVSLVRATLGKSSGKWYWEVMAVTTAQGPIIGVAPSSLAVAGNWPGISATSYGYYGYTGQKWNSGAGGAYGATFGAGDIIGVALDMDAGTLTFYKNGVSQGVAYTGLTGTLYPSIGWTGGFNGGGVANFGPLTKFQPPAGFNAGLFTASGLPTFATWNPSDKAGTLTLSADNLTVSGSKGVRSTQSKTSGKWYWEVVVGASNAGQIGVASSGYTLSNYLGQDASGWAYGGDGSKYNNGSAVAYGATYTTNDTIGVALDLDNGTLTFYKNGVSQGVAYTGLSGTLFAAIGGNLNSATTTNFGATPFTYAPPAGYSHGVASAAFTPTINYATWDPNDKGSGTTLSNGNLTQTTSGSNSGVRSNAGKSRGKWYWETTITTSGSYEMIGIGNMSGTAVDTNYPGNGNSVAWATGAGVIRWGGTTGYSPGTATTGDVIGIASASNGNMVLYKNGAQVWAGTLISLVDNIFAMDGASSSGADTANFGATALKFAPPAGYSWGLGDHPISMTRLYSTLNPADKSTNYALTEGNLRAVCSTGASLARATLGKSSGKWYWEVKVQAVGQSLVGVAALAASVNTALGFTSDGYAYYYGGTKINNSSGVAYGAAYTTSDIIGVALDMDAGTLTFYKNGVSQGVAYTGLTGTLYPAVSVYTSTYTWHDLVFGSSSFAYPAPAGFTGLF